MTHSGHTANTSNAPSAGRYWRRVHAAEGVTRRADPRATASRTHMGAQASEGPPAPRDLQGFTRTESPITAVAFWGQHPRQPQSHLPLGTRTWRRKRVHPRSLGVISALRNQGAQRGLARNLGRRGPEATLEPGRGQGLGPGQAGPSGRPAQGPTRPGCSWRRWILELG